MRQKFSITRKSPFSGKINSIDIELNESDYLMWMNGTLIQNAMPYLTADEREFIMTGITPQEWENEFGKGKQKG